MKRHSLTVCFFHLRPGSIHFLCCGLCSFLQILCCHWLSNCSMWMWTADWHYSKFTLTDVISSKILDYWSAVSEKSMQNVEIEVVWSVRSYRNHASILYRFKVIASYLSKFVLTNPTSIWRPRWVWPYSNFTRFLATETSSPQAVVWHCLRDPLFSRFDKNRAWQRHTYTQTYDDGIYRIIPPSHSCLLCLQRMSGVV